MLTILVSYRDSSVSGQRRGGPAPETRVLGWIEEVRRMARGIDGRTRRRHLLDDQANPGHRPEPRPIPGPSPPPNPVPGPTPDPNQVPVPNPAPQPNPTEGPQFEGEVLA